MNLVPLHARGLRGRGLGVTVRESCRTQRTKTSAPPSCGIKMAASLPASRRLTPKPNPSESLHRKRRKQPMAPHNLPFTSLYCEGSREGIDCTCTLQTCCVCTFSSSWLHRTVSGFTGFSSTLSHDPSLPCTLECSLARQAFAKSRMRALTLTLI